MSAGSAISACGHATDSEALRSADDGTPTLSAPMLVWSAQGKVESAEGLAGVQIYRLSVWTLAPGPTDGMAVGSVGPSARRARYSLQGAGAQALELRGVMPLCDHVQQLRLMT